jgi:hypothetical protein
MLQSGSIAYVVVSFYHDRFPFNKFHGDKVQISLKLWIDFFISLVIDVFSICLEGQG